MNTSQKDKALTTPITHHHFSRPEIANKVVQYLSPVTNTSSLNIISRSYPFHFRLHVHKNTRLLSCTLYILPHPTLLKRHNKHQTILLPITIIGIQVSMTTITPSYFLNNPSYIGILVPMTTITPSYFLNNSSYIRVQDSFVDVSKLSLPNSVLKYYVSGAKRSAKTAHELVWISNFSIII